MYSQYGVKHFTILVLIWELPINSFVGVVAGALEVDGTLESVANLRIIFFTYRVMLQPNATLLVRNV